MIDYSKFQKSLQHLESQFEHYSTMEESYPLFIKEAVEESVVKRFKICFDCMQDALRNFLTEHYGLDKESDNPLSVFCLAQKKNLLTSSMEEFLSYTKARVATSHDSSGEKAQDALKLIPDFINDAIGLYQIMSNKLWKP